MAAFKLDKEDREHLIDLLVEEFAEHASPEDLKECIKELLTKGLGEFKPYCEMKDEELIKQLKSLADVSGTLGALVDKLVHHGINEKSALMIAHEFSDHVEKLKEDEHHEELHSPAELPEGEQPNL